MERVCHLILHLCLSELSRSKGQKVHFKIFINTIQYNTIQYHLFSIKGHRPITYIQHIWYKLSDVLNNKICKYIQFAYKFLISFYLEKTTTTNCNSIKYSYFLKYSLLHLRNKNKLLAKSNGIRVLPYLSVCVLNKGYCVMIFTFFFHHAQVT